jgi:hypothetical protein
MNRPYFIGYKDESLGKYLFLGLTDSSWFSDFQSARAHSRPEVKKALPAIKRQYKDKKLKVIKIQTTEV